MLKFCTKCSHRAMDRNRGVVCGLTQDEPNFDNHCVDFLEDEKVVRIEKERFDNKKEYPTISYFNNSEYRSVSFYKLGWFVGAMFLLFLLNVFMVSEFKNNSSALFMQLYSSHGAWFTKVIVILFLAKTISNLKQGLFASLFIVGYHFFMTSGYSIYGFLNDHIYLVPLIKLLETAIIMYILTFSKFRTLNQLWFVTLTCLMFAGLSILPMGTSVLAEWLDKDTYTEQGFTLIVNSLGVMLVHVVSALLTVAIFNQISHNRNWHDFTLDLRLEKNKWILLKSLILGLSMLFLMAGIVGFTIISFKSIGLSDPSSGVGSVLFNTFSFVVFSLFSLWYLIIYMRKIILEFFLTRGLSISWLYVLSCIPLFGCIILLFLQFAVPTSNAENRMGDPNVKIDNRSITITLGLALLVYLFFAMSSPPALILVVFGVIFYLILLMFNFGVYFVFVSRILVFIFLVSIVADAIDLRIAEAGFRRLMTLYLIGMIYPFFLHPLFHLKHYQINSYEDVEIAESGQED